MSTATSGSVDLYQFVQPVRLRLLKALLAAVPKAKEEFEAGNPARAFKLIREARVEVSDKIPYDKERFLFEVLEGMPGDYRYED